MVGDNIIIIEYEQKNIGYSDKNKIYYIKQMCWLQRHKIIYRIK